MPDISFLMLWFDFFEDVLQSRALATFLDMHILTLDACFSSLAGLGLQMGLTIFQLDALCSRSRMYNDVQGCTWVCPITQKCWHLWSEMKVLGSCTRCVQMVYNGVPTRPKIKAEAGLMAQRSTTTLEIYILNACLSLGSKIAAFLRSCVFLV